LGGAEGFTGGDFNREILWSHYYYDSTDSFYHGTGKGVPVERLRPGTYYLVYNNNSDDNSPVKVRFTLADLVTCLIKKGLLPEGSTVQDLLTVSDTVSIRNLGGGNIEIYKEDLDQMNIFTLENGTNPDGISIRLKNTDGFISGYLKVLNYNGINIESTEIKIYYLEQPLDRMLEYLIPLSIATTARLVRNYYRYYY
jgi:hypothetical protein